MFGIKTRLVKLTKKYFVNLTKGKISNDLSVRELMVHFHADEYGHRANIAKADLGYGWIHYGLIRSIKPKRVLCIGSRHGFIPAICAQACKDNKRGYVDFVDPGYGPEGKNHWTGVGFWRTKEGKECFEKFGLGEWISLYIMESTEFAKKFKKRPYEYIYVDGDHSYKGVSTDYKLFWPRLKIHGFMVFHDVDVKRKLPEGIYGVQKLWAKISENSAVKLPFEGSGLGISQKI